MSESTNVDETRESRTRSRKALEEQVSSIIKGVYIEGLESLDIAFPDRGNTHRVLRSRILGKGNQAIRDVKDTIARFLVEEIVHAEDPDTIVVGQKFKTRST